MDEIKLITLYFFICESYDAELRWHCQRFSPNQQQRFTDEELLTIYLYVVSVEKHLSIKSIRQPIESFFNWLIFHTDIQNASKIRSANGLLVHIFGKIAAVLTLWARF